jgi:hypothetical protein
VLLECAEEFLDGDVSRGGCSADDGAADRTETGASFILSIREFEKPPASGAL